MDNKKITAKQEAFISGIMTGKTQRQAYLDAYPSARKWTTNSVDVAAAQLMQNEKIIARLKELGWRDNKKIEWSRQKALETVHYVMEKNKEDLDRIYDAYQMEVDILEARLTKLAASVALVGDNPQQVYKIASEMNEITAKIAECKKMRRVNTTNIRGIYEGAKILNRMYGLDITKVEINTEDEERNEMEKLSVDELRELIKVSNKENT